MKVVNRFGQVREMPARYARILTSIGQVRPVVEVPVVQTPIAAPVMAEDPAREEVEQADDLKPSKRRYKRRDMAAED